MVNEAVKTTSGNVDLLEKGLKLTYDLDHAARLINIEEYGVEGFDAFYGFIGGLLAGNYDITEVFIDATLKIGGRDLAAFTSMVTRLDKVVGDNASITFYVSCVPSENCLKRPKNISY
jgi:hypothetical protein